MLISIAETEHYRKSSVSGGFTGRSCRVDRLVRMATCLLVGTLLQTSSRAQSVEVNSVLIRLIDEVEVPARALGALENILVEPGDMVASGELLAQIDDAEAALQQQRAEMELVMAEHLARDDVAVRSAQKAAAFARADYERLLQADRERPRSVSQSELERAKLDAEQAELDLEQARSEFELARMKEGLAATDLAMAQRNKAIRQIKSPLNGVVVQVQYRPGEWVKPGDTILRILRTDRLRAEGFVDAAASLQELRGAQVSVLLGPKSDQPPFRGKVVFVSPEIDPVNNQVRVLADIENTDGRLRPGLRAQMIIHTDRTKE